MKALYFEQHGELDAVKYGDVPDPEPGPGEVLIRVRACALNFLDIWVRRGWPGLNLEMPHWCGADVAGEIAGFGPDVSGWQVGQRVVVDPGINLSEDEYTRRGEDSISRNYHVLGEHLRGGAAEYLKIPIGNLAALPEGIDFADAAAPILVTLMAGRSRTGQLNSQVPQPMQRAGSTMGTGRPTVLRSSRSNSFSTCFKMSF